MGTPEHNSDSSLQELEAKLAEAESRAAAAEKRYKDTQASFTKGQQEISSLRAEVAELSKLAQFHVTETPELLQLKYEDPDAWRREMNRLENEAKAKYQESLKATQANLTKEQVIAERAQILREFNARHPECQITDDVIALEVPPRIVKQLDSGKPFEEVLEEIHHYLTHRKVSDGQTTPNEPDMSRMAGGAHPQSQSSTTDDDDYIM